MPVHPRNALFRVLLEHHISDFADGDDRQLCKLDGHLRCLLGGGTEPACPAERGRGLLLGGRLSSSFGSSDLGSHTQQVRVAHQRQRLNLFNRLERRTGLHCEGLTIFGDAASGHQDAALLQCVDDRLLRHIFVAQHIGIRRDGHTVAARPNQLRLAHPIEITDFRYRNAFNKVRRLLGVDTVRREHRDLHDRKIIKRPRHHLGVGRIGQQGRDARDGTLDLLLG